MHSHIKFILRKYCNPSTFFVFILAVLALFNSLLTLNIEDNGFDSKEVSFYVLGERQTPFFETINTVLIENRLWEVAGSDFEVGYEYQAIVDVKNLYSVNSDNGFEVYRKSSGVQGEIVVDGSPLRNEACDYLCRFLTTLENNRRKAKYRSLRFACHDLYPIIEPLYYTQVTCEDVGSLVTGLIYGDTNGISEDVSSSIRKFGLSHLVAVSGFQVVLVATFVEMLFRKIRLSLHFRLLISALALLILVFFVGAEPPILRSFLSIIVLYFARLLGRRCTQLRALTYSSLILLVINPFYLFSISFQLSFLATLALLLTRFKTTSLNFLMAPVNAFLFTIPIIAGFVGLVSPVGVLANIVVAPFVSFVTYLSIIGFVPWVGDFALAIVNLILLLFLNLVTDLAQSIDFITLSKFTTVELVAYYTILILILKVMPRLKIKHFIQDTH